jgi:hypothetical protein
MKIKKNTVSTLVLELFFPSIANCRKLKIQKSTSPNGEPTNRLLPNKSTLMPSGGIQRGL